MPLLIARDVPPAAARRIRCLESPREGIARRPGQRSPRAASLERQEREDYPPPMETTSSRVSARW
jgi:hypothetical protein